LLACLRYFVLGAQQSAMDTLTTGAAAGWRRKKNALQQVMRADAIAIMAGRKRHVSKTC